jgi:anti-sigma regulatory factor (Ser/Thr protein kinase)
VRAAMRGFAGLHNVNEADLETLTCAVGEALANAIEHGGEGDEVEVQCRIDGQTITVTVTDWGRGFDEVPSGPVPMPHDAAENGRGIPIMQRCTHFFRVDSRPGEGTVVTLVRYRDGRRPAGGDGIAS